MINMSPYWFLICCCLIHTHTHMHTCMWDNVGRRPGAVKYDFLFFHLSVEDRVFLLKSQKFLIELQGAIGCHVVC